MLVGHLAVGFAAKRVEPKVSLGTWVLAAVFADLVAFVLMIAGVERFLTVPGVTSNRFIGEIPYSHSLLMDVVWAALFTGVYFLRRHYPRGAWLLFVVVMSHWVLDLVSHRQDVQLAPGPHPAFGLGLWNSLRATWIVEGGLWLAAIILYVRATRGAKLWGVFVFWIGIILFTLAWNGNIRAGVDPNAVRAGIGGLIFFSLMVAWAYVVNRSRRWR